MQEDGGINLAGLTDTNFTRICALLDEYPLPWAVCGGWAIDLLIGQQTRSHKDVDIAVFRHDQLAIQKYLREQGWHLQKIVAKELLNWDIGEYLTLPAHNIWCNHVDYPPNYLEILFSDVVDDYFCFRKDFSIKRPIEKTFVKSSSGVPILAPEIVLLYKSRSLDNSAYQHDFAITKAHLSSEQHTWLKDALQKFHGEHPWLNEL